VTHLARYAGQTVRLVFQVEWLRIVGEFGFRAGGETFPESAEDPAVSSAYFECQCSGFCRSWPYYGDCCTRHIEEDRNDHGD
jgi:hypothetical protein